MYRSGRRLAVGSLMVVLVGACSSSTRVADVAATPVSTSPVAPATTTLPGKRIHVNFTSEGPIPTFGTQVCEAGACMLPATETGTFDGDIRGKRVTGSAGATVPGNTDIASTRTDIFIVTVKGCGTGTFVTVGTETVTGGTSGTGEVEVVPGWGTGDLANLTGRFTGEGGLVDGKIQSTFEGDLVCG